MQSNIFVKMAPLLKEKKFDLVALETFFKRYHTGEWIYPSAMRRVLNLSIQQIYEVLEEGVTCGVFEQNLEIYCPNCHRFAGIQYKTVYNIPGEVNCIHCDFEIEHPLKHAIVIYRVL